MRPVGIGVPRGCAAVLLGVLFVAPSPGLAQEFPNDLRVYQFGEPCVGTVDAPARPCEGEKAHDRFAALVNELAVTISAFNLQPPETLGHSAFNMAFEYAVVFVNKNTKIHGRPFWQNELRRNDFDRADNSAMLVPMAHFRKGLPFSFEVGARVGYLSGSHLAFGMIEFKWALNEGFLFVPDLGVRGFSSRLVGSRDFDVTSAGLDIGLGKQFAIGGMVTLTPYAGWNIIWASGTSNVIDFFPERLHWKDPTTGQPAPYNAITRGTDRTNVFNEVMMGNNYSNRFYGGLRFIGNVVEVGAEVSYVQLSTRLGACRKAADPPPQPHDCTVDGNGRVAVDGVSNRSVLAVSAKAGVDF